MMFTLTGCYQDYLEDPYYNGNSETVYPIRVKDNAFTGVPAMVGDLVGCAIELPFAPIYLNLRQKYVNDADATQSLFATYGFLPRVLGRIVSSPFRLLKFAVYDIWVYPGT